MDERICRERLRVLLRFGRKNSGPWDEAEFCACDGVLPDDGDADFIVDAIEFYQQRTKEGKDNV